MVLLLFRVMLIVFRFPPRSLNSSEKALWTGVLHKTFFFEFGLYLAKLPFPRNGFPSFYQAFQRLSNRLRE